MSTRKHTRNGKRIAVLAAVLFLSSAFIAIQDDLFLISKNLDIFSAVYRQVSVNYVDQTDPDKLVKTAVNAMLDDLDPYTEYVAETDVEDYRLKYVDTKYGGIGASIFEREGRIFISELYAGYPADEAGLQVGDELVAIDGTPVSDKPGAEVSQLLRGTERSSVQLDMLRGGTKRDVLTLTRRVIRQPNVSHTAVLDGAIGYIKLDKFLAQSANEVMNAWHGLQQKQQLNGLVLDLRNNGGGIVQEAVKIVNLFVSPGELVVSQKGKNAAKRYSYHTTATPLAPEIPLVVLINGYSASAAEIVAGALQDLDRAVVVGERSYGKGLVQQTFPIPYNNLLKVTVAKYYTPSGRCIQLNDFAQRSDSSIHAFNTKRGRVVYDGSGIHPDILIEKIPYSPITQALLDRYFIFDYVNDFKRKHKQVAPADQFEVGEADYADFVQFLGDKDYHYLSQTEVMLKQVKALAETEKKPEAILQELESLERKLYRSKQHDLTRHQDEIKEVLGREIVSRYYYAAGRARYSLEHDPQLERAQTILTTPTQEYYSILSGEGEYKTIGQPEPMLAAVETEN